MCHNVMLLLCFVYITCRLGQACNHVAALLFYNKYHDHCDELPTEKSRTFLPMKWNQPRKCDY